MITANSSRSTEQSSGTTESAPGSPPPDGPAADIVEDTMDLKPLRWGIGLAIVVWVILVLIVWAIVS